ncbi:MAG TPA: glycoside hydrolase family 5 protein [Bacteroidales bacterium]|jgi:endoglucanase|nr:glycoside hydrolase family 5 protein [Bacteroidales bacterium]
MKSFYPFLFVVLILSARCSSEDPKDSPVAVNGQLAVSGTQLVNEEGNPVILRGASFGWHNLWPRFYNDKAVDWIVDDWKCNVVRASMGVAIEDNYLENPEYALQCVNNVVKGAINKGIYVLIDFHSHKKHTEEAVKFFEIMAQQYRDYPNVIYEIWNEPDYYSWKEVKEYSEQVIDAIRTIDDDNIILVGSPHWDQDIDTVAADPITGRTNIMYTMHFYAGTHKKWLRDKTDAAIEKGVPIFVSECAGMEASGDGPIDEAEWNQYIDWMESRKISWIAWSISDKNETCSMLIPRASSYGEWTDDVLKKWGKITRQTIRERQGQN